MSSVVISGDSSGTVTLTVPSAAGTNTATLPAATGTVMVTGNMPAFGAYASSTQSVTGGANTKVLFDIEEFDTNSNFASSRFTPTVAGYYQLSSCVRPNSVNGEAQVSIYKNGSSHKNGSNVSATSSQFGTTVSSLVYANGSTDYFEIYIYVSNTGTTSLGVQSTWFNGCLMRNA